MKWLNFFRSSKPKTKPFSAWQIELTTRCPLRCRMCIREKAKDWHGSDMNIEDFKKLVPYLKDVETVILEGWGESLLHKHLVEAVRLVKGAESQVGFVTSGFGLNENYISELIHAGVDFIGFSLAGATDWPHNSIRVNSDFRMLINSILRVNEIKVSEKLSTPRLHIVYLMLKDNVFEVPALLELAQEMNISDVVLTNLIHVTDEWQDGQRVFRCTPESFATCHSEGVPIKSGRLKNLTHGKIHEGSQKRDSSASPQNDNLEQYEEILKEAEAKAKELKIKLRRPFLSPQNVSVCEENPLRNIYISVEGEVSPCVYLYPPISSPFKRIFCGNEYYVEKMSFGNIFRETFHAIWNNKKYAEFRKCFMLRKKRFEEIYSYHWDIERLKRLRVTPLPEPPEQCKTCHKMLGV